MRKEIVKKYIIYVFILLMAVIVGLYVTLPIVPQIFNKVTEIRSKNASINDKKAQLEVIEQNKLKEQENNIKVIKLVYEPDMRSSEAMVNFNGLLEAVLNLAKQNGIKTRSIEFKTIPESDIVQKNHSATHNATLLKAQMVGTYTELQNFLRDIYRYQYVMSIYELKVSPYAQDKKILIIDLSLGLYSKK